MQTYKSTKDKPIVHKTQHRKLKTEQHEPLKNLEIHVMLLAPERNMARLITYAKSKRFVMNMY